VRRLPNRKQIVENLIWFILSLLLGFIVWLTASLASNPVTQADFPADGEEVPIQILVDENVLITNQPRLSALLVVRATESTLEDLSPEDIQVVADLRGITTFGSRTVPLTIEVSERRQASVVSITPSQITVDLEQRQERFVPLDLQIVGDVAASVEVDDPTSNITQILVSGPSSLVSEVDVARATIDVSDRRESFDVDVRPILLDSDGNSVNGLAASPDVVGVSVDIELRSDVREVRVAPNIIGEPPEGYTLSADFLYSPETIFVTGPPEALETLPGTLLTAPIDLSTYTSDFEIRVPVELPDDNIVPITGQRISVSIGIDPIQSSRQFERVSVEVVGVSDGFVATATPAEVTVIVNGPQLVLSELEISNVRAIVDIGAITEPGTYQLQPVASVNVGQIESENLSIIPTTVDIQVQFAESGPPGS
jgi:YbbR domain-containing protein